MLQRYRIVCPRSAASLALSGDRRALVALGVGAWFVALAVVLTAAKLGLLVNTSPSVPLGFYWLSNATPLRGDYVAACPPPSPLFEWARATGRLSMGRCPGGFAPLLKVLAADGGDSVRVDADGVRVNDVHWPSSAPLREDASGQPLPRLAGFHTTLRAGEVLLMSEHCALGFDGRYFGPLPTSAVTASAVPLFTW